MMIQTRRGPSARARLSLLLMMVTFALLSPIAIRATVADDDRLANQPKSEYRARRQALLAKIKDGIVVLIGAREDEFGEVGRFRQKNDFMYLTGVQTPAAYLLFIPAGLSPDKPAQETVFIPARNQIQEKWTGPQIGPGAEAESQFGIQEVADAGKFNDRLRELLNSPLFKSADGKSTAKLYTRIPRGSDAELQRETRFIERIKRDFPHVQIVDVSPVIAEMRKLKTSAEVAVLQRAIDISGEGQREALRTSRPGAFEYEVQAALEAAFTRNGAERTGYPSIVGSGYYSTILHYNENHKKIEDGDLVVVDVGAEYSYYTADITRTYPASGKFTARQRDVYNLVLAAQRAAEKAYKPGVTLAQLQSAATETMKASPLRDKQGNTLERYFIHGLGHWLGMDVHDVGGYGNLPVGSVFTIEPGIYIPDEQLGVRIEDDYLVTETGLVKLSRAIPSDPDEIERLMSTRPKIDAAKGNR
jgi:Xaa-Pro aminopeptidase